jgi:kynurenine formamidase
MPLPDEFHDLARKVNNWGRWGEDDERGTLNLVTSEVVQRAAACVQTGRAFSLAIPLSVDGPQTGAIPGRSNPVRTMLTVNEPFTGDPTEISISDDVVFMGLQAATHWDSLAHVSYGGRKYNGHPASSVSDQGASHLGIDRVGPLVSRGVLLDVARALGVSRLEPGTGITPEDLDTAERLAGVTVEPGDVVLLRTGHIQLLHEGRRRDYGTPSPGPTMACALWFHDRDVAAVATDNMTFEVYPGERKDCLFPLHLLDLVEMGMLQGQNFDLEELAVDCANDGVYRFLLEASPEPFVAGLGGPVNPVAVK